MKAALLLAVLALLTFGASCTDAETAVPKPPAAAPPKAHIYVLSLLTLADPGPQRCIFVVDSSVGYSTVKSLENGIAGTLPPGSTLQWSPSCCRRMSDPSLSAADEDDLRVFCAKAQIKFVHILAG